MAVPPHFLGSMTLKALLEDPILKNPPVIGLSASDQLKGKKENDGSDLPQFNYGSAFLGPNLWDRSVDNSDFNLEYMDLDEFLSENGIPIVGDETLKVTNPVDASLPGEWLWIMGVTNQPPLSPREYLKSPPMSPSQYLKPSAPSPDKFETPPQQPVSKSPSPPVSPFNVDFQVSEQDLALTAIPDYGEDSSTYVPKWQARSEEKGKKNGQEGFDPRRRNFTEEELKPQPIIKKSKKIFVPDDLKDERYWARRHKNNYAAKRSRDARRVKENQIALRAAFLEKENSCLRDEMNKLRKENAKLKSKVAKYEGSAIDDVGISQ
ncbi:unnamed protein product [Lymnaea stagnalis]|uniref:BZIP domain-containing protein n=1 Tax=Lymnaea stagnalis TaxID=6523 RepID=A0AAV2HQ73_LYMST